MRKQIVFTFGRFNPPTTGHYLLASKVKQEALRRSADHRIYGSMSYDRKRNPLSSKQKLRFMKKALKGFNVLINNKVKTPFDALSELDKEGYTDVVMVVGGDRVNEFKKSMSKYIGPNKIYKFEKFEVVSAGERDPDAENIQGMSASKMRVAAKEGNLNAFRLGVPSHVSTNDTQQLFKAVQLGMGVKPFVSENWFNYDEFVEFLKEENEYCMSKNILKKFDMGGEGIDVPAIDNEVWGTKGFKKKKRKEKIDEKTMAAKLVKSASGYALLTLDDVHIKRGSSKNELLTHAKNTNIRVHDTTSESVESNESELNEISIQSRRKMARSARRTAKKRMRKRKMKEKRKKSGAEIKKKAQKAAISKLRARMIKGMNWNELSFSQREKIEDRLKKKKNVISKLAKRLVPQARRAEQERLKKVRAKMTTNDPAKAIESFDASFKSEVLNESNLHNRGVMSLVEFSRMQKSEQIRIAKERERNRGTGAETPQEKNTADKRGEREVEKRTDSDLDWKDVYIVKNKSGQVRIVTKTTASHDILVDKGKVKLADGKRAVNGKYGDFKGTLTSVKLLGRAAVDAAEKKTQKMQQQQQTPQPEELTGQGGETREMTPKEMKAAEKEEKKQLKSERDKQLKNLENQEAFQSLDAKIQENVRKLLQKTPTSGAKYPVDFPAVMIEAGMVLEFNRMQGLDDSVGNVSENDSIKAHKSMTLLSSEAEKYGHGMESASARAIKTAIIPFIEKVDPDKTSQWHLEHTGSGTEEAITTSEHFQEFGAKNATPKSDIIIVQIDKNGVRHEHGTSIKAGPGQLMSPAPGEAMAILMGVMGKQKSHCVGKDTKHCKSLMELEPKTKEKVKALVKKLEDKTKMYLNSGKGVGPFNWFTPGGSYTCGASKGCDEENPPKWWDTYGPGSAGVNWNEVYGKAPKPEHWKNTKASEYDPEIVKIIADSEKLRNDLTASINDILNESPSFKEGMVHEAMTGCIKFCGCCNAECGCNNAVANLYFTMNPDGTGSNIREMDNNLVENVSDNTKFIFAWKGSQREIIVDGKKMKTGDYANYMALRSSKMSGKEKATWAKQKQQELAAGFLSFREYDNILTEQPDELISISNNSDAVEEGKKKLNEIGGDPMKLMNFLNIELENFSTNELEWQEIGSKEISDETTEINVDGKSKFVSILKYKPEKEDEENEDYLGLSSDEWKNYDKLSKKAKSSEIENSLGRDVNESATEKERQKQNILPGKNKTAQNKLATFKSHTTKKKQVDTQQQNVATTDEQYIAYNFKESLIEGIGTFSTNNIKEGEGVGLYYINLLSENSNAPEYQRTDFCRFTNHSWSNPNLVLVENRDGNFYTHAIRDINEGEELLIDYFNVFELILPALKEEGLVIPEVLRWTDGYDDMEIPPDKFEDLRDELEYFIEINEAPYRNKKQSNENEDPVNRAKRLKKYNAQPEQRKRRSARTGMRNRLIRDGRLSVGDGKDIDHKDGNPLNNSSSNIQITSASRNRSRNNNKWRAEEHGAGEIGTEKLIKRYIKDTPYMTITRDK